MAEALLVKSGGGTDSGDLTATLSQVLSGYTAVTSDSNDDAGTGTMPNRGAVNQSLNAGSSYTIPQGYHNGSGVVSANSLASQTSANAGAAQILSGYNAWVNGNKVSGTMTNRGTVNQSLNAGGSYTIPQGYHSGSGRVIANSLASQTDGTAGAGQILSGYTAWVDGSKVTGNMANRGTLNFNPSSSTSQSVSAGYYSGGTLSSANAYNAGYNAGKVAATPQYQKVGSQIASGTPTNFTYTFTESKTIFVVSVGMYDQTPFSLDLYLNGNANITQKEYAKHEPVVYAIWQVVGARGQSINLTSQAYTNNSHMVESYIIG